MLSSSGGKNGDTAALRQRLRSGKTACPGRPDVDERLDRDSARRRGHATTMRSPRPLDARTPPCWRVQRGVGRSQSGRVDQALTSPRRGDIWATGTGVDVLVISSTVYNEIPSEPSIVVMPIFEHDPDSGFGVPLDAGMW